MSMSYLTVQLCVLHRIDIIYLPSVIDKYFTYYFFFFLLFRAKCAAYGSSQARGQN